MASLRLRRSRDALAGGVCAGLADRLGVDAVVVRIPVVLLGLMTCGLGFVAYAILWAVLPQESAQPHPLEVKPHEAESETYGVVEIASDDAPRKHRLRRVAPTAPDPEATREVAARREMYAGAGHEPPVPPLAARAAAAAVASRIARGVSPVDQAGSPAVGAPAAPASVAVVAASVSATVSTASAAPASAAATASAAASEETPSTSFAATPGKTEGAATPASRVSRPERRLSPRARAVLRSLLLWVILAAAFVGLLRLLGLVIHGVSWWRFWPLFLSLSGIAVMVVPARRGVRMAHAVTGWFLFIAGNVILPMSVGLVRWASLVPWLRAFWPLLVFSVAFLLVAWLRRSWPWALAAGVLFSILCVGGLLTFALPGNVPFITVDLPFGRDFLVSYPFR